MQIRYTGPFDQVEIAATGQVVDRGQTVDIEDQAVAAALLTQADTWKKVSAPKTSSKTTTSKEK